MQERDKKDFNYEQFNYWVAELHKKEKEIKYISYVINTLHEEIRSEKKHERKNIS